jgi:hypothetical protein
MDTKVTKVTKDRKAEIRDGGSAASRRDAHDRSRMDRRTKEGESCSSIHPIRACQPPNLSHESLPLCPLVSLVSLVLNSTRDTKICRA